MSKKREIVTIICFLFSIILIASVSATCCEKTKDGLYCQILPAGSTLCEDGRGNVPTSCEQSSYCQTGTCINTNEGICTSTSKIACEDPTKPASERGTWVQGDGGAQCQDGCCVLGEKTAFVTSTRCGNLASLYGLKSDFRATVLTQADCQALANPSEKGACTFTNDKGQTDCEFITNKACTDKKAADPTRVFHSGYLCSAQTALGTICAPRGGTVCDDATGKVLTTDTCNQPGNVYDSTKWTDDASGYWTFIQNPDSATCSITDAKGSATCGNCDYNLGSTCKPVKAGERVDYGTNICRDLDCKGYVGQGFTGSGTAGIGYPKASEMWCAQSNGSSGGIYSNGSEIKGDGNNAPGSQYYKLMCFNGEVTSANCDNGVVDGARAKVCVQSNLGTDTTPFLFATCRDNLYLSCYSLNNSNDCTNKNNGDCKWVENGYYLTASGLGNKTETDASTASTLIPNGTCVPLWAPGFVKSSADSSANGAEVCGKSTFMCNVTYRFTLIDDFGNWWAETFQKKLGFEDSLKQGLLTAQEKYAFCTKWDAGVAKTGGDNCQCLLYGDSSMSSMPSSTSWKNTINGICSSLGDCGLKKNFIGTPGEDVKIIDIKTAEEGAG